MLDEFIESLCCVAVESIAAGDGHISELLVVVSDCMVTYFLDQTLGEQGKFLFLSFGNKDCKLIAAVAVDVDGDVEVTNHQVCKLDEHGVTCIMTIGIVESFEVVNIKQNDTYGVVSMLLSPQFALQGFFEVAAVE